MGDPSLAWSPELHILVTAVDLLAGANWQRGGGKGNRPKPIPRPGEKKASTDTHWGTAVPIEEARRILDARKGVNDGG